MVIDVGKYQPNTLEGRKLLAHELTHVIQQSRRSGAHIGHIDQKSGLQTLRMDLKERLEGIEMESRYLELIDYKEFNEREIKTLISRSK